MVKVNIVVPTYNGKRFLDPLWKCLKENISDEINWKLTLVDDGSIDGTDKWAEKHPEINYVRNEANVGFAKSCNRGAKSLEAEYILFLNNDTEPQKGFLEYMLKIAEDNYPKFPIVGAKLLTIDGRFIQHAGIRFMAASGYPYEYGQGRPADDYSCNKSREAEAVTAACMLVKKDIFDKLGGFCEEFINGWEDVDFCLRAREAGFRIYYCAEAIVLHHRFASEGRFLHEAENKTLFKDKWIHYRRLDVITPFWMAVAATWRCNLMCKHCDIWKKQSEEEINIHEFQKWISHEFFNNINNIAIFGGEPTLFHKIVDLIAICADRWKGAEIGIITNGTLPENQRKIWETIANNLRGNFVVRVSIDGSEEVHDELRGVKRAFQQAVETVKIVNTIWPKKCGISITVYPDTVDELPYLIDLVQKLGITFCIRAGVSGSYFGGKVLGKWTNEKIDKFEKIMNSAPDYMKSFDKFVFALPHFLREGVHKPCEAYRKSLVVNTDLMVSICHEREPLAHLKDIPRVWGRTKEWCLAGYEALSDKCFKPSCFIDGPYSCSYIAD